MRNIQLLFGLVLLCTIDRGSAVCSREYGGEPCKFVPALPGNTPNCARPGYTYCENLDYYPTELVHYLVDKWVYNYNTLLSNESPEEFSAYAVPSQYNYPSNIVYEHHTISSVYGPPGHTSKTHYEQSRLNTYLQQNYSGFPGYAKAKPNGHFYQEIPSNVRYNFKQQQTFNRQPQHSAYYSPHQVSYYTPNEWWKRYSRDPNKNQSFISKRRKRSLKEVIPPKTFTNSTGSNRNKRQSRSAGQSLCESRSTYIMPRAALNNQGRWMYIVNMPNESGYTQLVKSETCLSQQCSGLCILPDGFTSRCEQKYVQKRLVALEDSGNQLYTDIFWFPSCCACTITRT